MNRSATLDAARLTWPEYIGLLWEILSGMLPWICTVLAGILLLILIDLIRTRHYWEKKSAEERKWHGGWERINEAVDDVFKILQNKNRK